MFVAIHGVDIGFLYEKQYHQQREEGTYDDYFKKSETFFVAHELILAYCEGLGNEP